MHALRHVMPPLRAPVSRRAWSLLDPCFSLHRLKAWVELASADGANRSGQTRPLQLVAIVTPARLPTVDDLRHDASVLLQELATHWQGLLPGMHRMTLAGGAVELTLCVGERTAMLRELQFAADAIFLAEDDAPWDARALSALGRCRQRGTHLAGPSHADPLAPRLREMGFVERGDHWICDPAWNLRAPAHHTVPRPVGCCAVIGAGLAGASVASRLAQRGWTVDVYEAADHAAAGASGLPAGLLIPHVSSADGPRSRLTRAGLRRMRQDLASRLAEGRDWAPTGVLELRPEGKSGLPEAWPAQGQTLSHPIRLEGRDGALPPWAQGSHTDAALWHAQAAWVKPAAIVRAWLDHPCITFHPGARIASLARVDVQPAQPLDEPQHGHRGTPGVGQGAGRWALRDDAGHVLGEADDVVVASALDAPRLLGTLAPGLPPAHGMRGVLSWGLQGPHTGPTASPNAPTGASAGGPTGRPADWPAHPVNGAGSFIPHVPTAEGLAWYAGSTYENTADAPAPLHAHLQADHDKLRRLLPAVADELVTAYAPGGGVRHWESVRCVSPDRMPWVGPVDPEELPGLWISAAMGSRGLSLALLCAELLVARMGAEPWPIEASLARALDLHRRKRVP